MRYRPLGRSGITISEIGFGTWGIGGTHQGAVAYGPTSDQESVAALERALQLGVTFYDTSDFYGQGHSETLLGQTFARRRQEVFIATKGGLVGPEAVLDYSPSHLEKALAQSLERLQTSYVDLYQLHSPPLELLQQDTSPWEWLEKIKAQGKTRLIGISVRSPEEGLAVVQGFPVDAIQVNFNLVDQRALEIGLLKLCQEKGVGLIIRTPLCFGFLTGALSGQESFPSGDHRNRWPEAQRQRWSEGMQLFWNSLQQREVQTPAQFSLRYCLSQPGVSTVIPGMLTIAQVEENVAASDLGLLEEHDLVHINQLYQGQSFFVGR
jgi:aryl-alcohol dehydrogenase-like predicted oxidoreductase